MRKLLLIQLVIFFASIAQAQIFTSSNLPIVIINTDNQQTIPDDPKIGALSHSRQLKRLIHRYIVINQ